jgi:hypothetical protein
LGFGFGVAVFYWLSILFNYQDMEDEKTKFLRRTFGEIGGRTRLLEKAEHVVADN